jgi:hypothetical protein
MQRAALPKLLAHASHRSHAKTEELGDLTTALASFVELENASTHGDRYGCHRPHSATQFHFRKATSFMEML